MPGLRTEPPMTSISPFLWIALAAFILAIPGGLLLFGSSDEDYNSWRPRRPHLARRLIGLLLILVALLGGLLAFSIHRYLQLFSDRPVALIELHQEGPQRFRASLLISGGGEAQARVQHFTLLGDAWLLEARVLRWRLPAALAGVPSLYRLERIAGRYDDIEKERSGERSVYAVNEPGMPDLFSLKREFPRWLPFVDAQYGSGTWMPMFDDARYVVLFNDRGGLLAKPADSRTLEMLEDAGWGGGT